VNVRVAALMLASVTGCAEDLGQRYDLDGLTVYVNFEGPVCSATFPYLERRLKWLEAELGLPRAEDPIVYRWFPDGNAEDICEGADCAIGSTMYGQLYSASHELVHAHLYQLGAARPWLAEGMATLLEDSQMQVTEAAIQDPEALMWAEDSWDVVYSDAARFTAYLRDRFGMPRLLEYYAASADTSWQEAIEAFEEVFEVDFWEVSAEYTESYDLKFLGAMACDGPVVAWQGEAWTHAFATACDDPGAMGPHGSAVDPEPPRRRMLWTEAVMEAPAGVLALEVEAPADGHTFVRATDCIRGDGVYLSPVYAPEGTWTRPAAGKVELRVYAPIDEEVPVTVRVRRVDEGSAVAARSASLPVRVQAPLPCQHRLRGAPK
jgi:hypothetical protein